MRNKKLWALIPLMILLVFIGYRTTVYFAKKRAEKVNAANGEKSVEQIMSERATQAGKQLNTPLGKAVLAKNWIEVNSLYHPESDFITLGEIIRALYIEQKIKTFSPDDQDKLMTFVLGTFDKMPEKNLHLSGMLISQFERLPSPKHDSLNFKILKQWVHDPKASSVKRKMAVVKLVLQDATPDPEASALYQKALISGDTLGQSRSDWIQEIDEIRGHDVQQTALTSLSKNFKKIGPDAQPSALIVLSHHLEVNAEQTKNLTMHFLTSGDLSKVEASLKAIVPLLHENRLNSGEKQQIVNALTNLPLPVRTPFVQMKSTQILNLLGHT